LKCSQRVVIDFEKYYEPDRYLISWSVATVCS